VRVSRGTTIEIQRFKSAFGGSNQRMKLSLLDAIKSRMVLQN
jgi:hypothetical protein